MINKNDYVMCILKNSDDKINALLTNFEDDGSVHYSYVIEKLESTISDLTTLISIAKDEKSKEEK